MKRLVLLSVFAFATSMAFCATDEAKAEASAQETVTAGQIKAVKNFSPEEKAEVKGVIVEKIKAIIDEKKEVKTKKISKKYIKISKKLFEKSALELKNGETAQATVTAGEAQAEATKEAAADSVTAKEKKAKSAKIAKEEIKQDLKAVNEEIQERKDINKEIKAGTIEDMSGTPPSDVKKK